MIHSLRKSYWKRQSYGCLFLYNCIIEVCGRQCSTQFFVTRKDSTGMFTLQNTLTQIIQNSPPLFSVFFSDSFLQLIPQDYRDRTMEELTDFVMPWGMPFPAEDMVHAVNMIIEGDRYWELIPLWSDNLTIETKDRNSVFLMHLNDTLEGIRPVAVICPGGGYQDLSFDLEGVRTAQALQKRGYRTFILSYRVSPNRYPAPQLDLLLAIRYLRANAAQYQIHPDDLTIMGYSAGGHLCASTAALEGELEAVLDEELKIYRPEYAQLCRGISGKPDKVCLCYPVISFIEPHHEPSFQCLTGGNESLREALSIETRVTADYPKTFLWTCADDSLVPSRNTECMDEALEKNGVPHKCVIYPQGEHGCSLGIGTSAEGWMDTMEEFFRG